MPMLDVPLRWLPPRLAIVTVACRKCGATLRPPWTHRLSRALIPMKPNDSSEEDPGRWVPAGYPVACDGCGTKTLIEVPHKSAVTRCYLYGDESERSCDNPRRHVFMYSLVGACAPVLPSVADAVREAKRCLLPSAIPDSWRLHMKELTCGQKRKKDPRFASLSRRDVDAIIARLLDIVSGDEAIWVYNIAVRGFAPGRAKYEAYLALLALVIDELTNQSAHPVLCFDSDRASRADSIVHGWARDLFRNSQYCLLYAFLTKGIEVPEPEFVQPGSHPCLELADLVGYVAARYYHHRWRGSTVEWEPKRLGKVMYAGVDGNGDLIYHRGDEYPWDMLH